MSEKMEKYKLSKQDINWLNELINITKSIESFYQMLFDLEIHNKKDTEDYKIYFKYLKQAILLENSAYQDIKLTYPKCNAFIDYIINYKINNPADLKITNNESIVMQNYNQKAYRRIFNILDQEKITNFSDFKEATSLAPNLYKIAKALGINIDNKNLSFDAYKNFKLQKAIDTDLLNGFLLFLQENIESKQFSDTKNNLIYTKYYTAFICKSVEDDMLASNFEISKDYYTKAKAMADIYGIDLNSYTMLKEVCGTSEVIWDLCHILELHDKEFLNPTTLSSSIMMQCFLRSAFLMLNEEMLAEFNYEFHDIVDSNEYNKYHLREHIGRDFVSNCFQIIRSDRSKVKEISLVLKK